jgi:alcohol dehydrogenase (NADP+)
METVKTTSEGIITIKAKEVKTFGTQATYALLQQTNIKRRKSAKHTSVC